MKYEKVYLASQGNPEPLSEEEILESRHLLVYVADYEGRRNAFTGCWRARRIFRPAGLRQERGSGLCTSFHKEQKKKKGPAGFGRDRAGEGLRGKLSETA